MGNTGSWSRSEVGGTMGGRSRRGDAWRWVGDSLAGFCAREEGTEVEVVCVGWLP